MGNLIYVRMKSMPIAALYLFQHTSEVKASSSPHLDSEEVCNLSNCKALESIRRRVMAVEQMTGGLWGTEVSRHQDVQ